MDKRMIWARLMEICGGRQYPHLEKYMKDAPIEVWMEFARLLNDFVQESATRGRRAAAAAFRKGQFHI